MSGRSSPELLFFDVFFFLYISKSLGILLHTQKIGLDWLILPHLTASSHSFYCASHDYVPFYFRCFDRSLQGMNNLPLSASEDEKEGVWCNFQNCAVEDYFLNFSDVNYASNFLSHTDSGKVLFSEFKRISPSVRTCTCFSPTVQAIIRTVAYIHAQDITDPQTVQRFHPIKLNRNSFNFTDFRCFLVTIPNHYFVHFIWSTS